jgi:hypothetical protein
MFHDHVGCNEVDSFIGEGQALTVPGNFWDSAYVRPVIIGVDSQPRVSFVRLTQFVCAEYGSKVVI